MKKIAELYDYTSQLIAHCSNSPECIAKAAMEHPEVRFFKAWGWGGWRGVGAVRPHMVASNNAESGYVAVAGVVLNVIDDAELSEIIER